MTRGDDSRAERVRRVLAVARRIHDASDPLGAEARARLLETTGLSREGIALAIDDCLETHVSSIHLDRLLARTGTAPRTWMIASANVFTAAVRAIALAVATSPAVAVRPSRRDPVVAELVVRELAADRAFATAGGAIALVQELTPAPGEEVHAYGRDETIAAISAALLPGVVLRGHGAGFGIAAVEADDDVSRAAECIARDVVRFDQRGCLSPRIVLVDGDGDRLRELAAALQGALASWRDRVPPGPVGAADRAELALFRRTMDAVADVYGDEGAMVVAREGGSPLVLPPPARAVVVVPTSPSGVASVLQGSTRFVAAVGRRNGSARLARALTSVAPLARASELGEMQRPPLDGPVDLRHLPA